MARREVIGRYRGSVIGLLWSFVYPLLILMVYTFVFGVIFKARFEASAQSQTDFAVVLFSGLIIHSLFAECINRSPNLISGNTNYVKRVVFPLEIFPWIAIGSALFHALASLVVLVAVHLALGNTLPWTVVFVPVVLLPFLVLSVGVSWFLAALGVFLRDVTNVVGVISTALLFLSPIFYPVSALPAWMQDWIVLNPLTVIINQLRDVLLWGRMPDWTALAVYTLVALAVAWAGLAWFQRTRREFADVL